MVPISVKNLDHVYPASRRKQSAKKVLDNLSLSVEPGEIFGLLGPNGGGKTTLFRILSTLLVPTQGVAQIFEIDVVKHPEEVRKKMGVVFQNPSLDKQLTVKENLVHQGHLHGLSGQPLHNEIARALAHFRLTERQNDFVEHLSGGLQRRVEIAKGLLHRPQVLLLDEPSTGLDPGARHDLWAILMDLKKSGVTVLLTTHLMEEGDKCDRVAILHVGQIRALGTPSELKSKIGGDIISIQTKEPASLSQKLKEQFGGDPLVFDHTVRIEKKEGHKFIPQVVEAYPGLIEAISVGKPTLEDVFVQVTGQRFFDEEAAL